MSLQQTLYNRQRQTAKLAKHELHTRVELQGNKNLVPVLQVPDSREIPCNKLIEDGSAAATSWPCRSSTTHRTPFDRESNKLSILRRHRVTPHPSRFTAGPSPTPPHPAVASKVFKTTSTFFSNEENRRRALQRHPVEASSIVPESALCWTCSAQGVMSPPQILRTSVPVAPLASPTSMLRRSAFFLVLVKNSPLCLVQTRRGHTSASCRPPPPGPLGPRRMVGLVKN